MRYSRTPLVLVLASALIFSGALAEEVVLLNGQSDKAEIGEETSEGHGTPDESEDEASVSDAVARGRAAAEEEFGTSDKLTFLSCGLFLNLIGVALARNIISEPPQSHLIGKSPEYVAAFSKAYNDRTGSKRITYAAIGCSLGSVTACILIWRALEDFDPSLPEGM